MNMNKKGKVKNIIESIERARRKAFKNTLPKGKTVEDAIEEEAKKMGAYYQYLLLCFKYIHKTEVEIKKKIEYLRKATNQNILDEMLLKELWILRYAYLIFIFTGISNPKKDVEVQTDLKLADKALEDVLKENEQHNNLKWLREGITDFLGGPEIDLQSFKKFRANFASEMSGIITHAAFNCTEGRLGGELHDGIIDLMQSTIETDKEYFTKL